MDGSNFPEFKPGLPLTGIGLIKLCTSALSELLYIYYYYYYFLLKKKVKTLQDWTLQYVNVKENTYRERERFPVLGNVSCNDEVF